MLATFVAASLVLAITPGPGVVYIVARTLAQGRASGLASALGVALGNFGNALGAALGLALLFAVSPATFTIVKLACASYLVWMGVKLWRAAGSAEAICATPDVRRRGAAQLLRDGFVVALLNPKTALFFAAFLPQFISMPAHAGAQTVALGGLFTLIALCSDAGYVLSASMLAPHLGRTDGARRWGLRAAGGAFIGLGLLTAFGGQPT
jgi:threonine/homoserine/homoserine lactone efflux protein